jgi:hypothetical protein
VFTALALTPGANNPSITVPCNITPGTFYARFRLSGTGTLGPLNDGGPGEVEDYRVELRPPDFGDAPNTYGTLLAANGPRHSIQVGFSLGANIDREPDGQPSAGADGDDLNTAPDDEDGVAFGGGGSAAMCSTAPSR